MWVPLVTILSPFYPHMGTRPAASSSIPRSSVGLHGLGCSAAVTSVACSRALRPTRRAPWAQGQHRTAATSPNPPRVPGGVFRQSSSPGAQASPATRLSISVQATPCTGHHRHIPPPRAELCEHHEPGDGRWRRQLPPPQSPAPLASDMGGGGWSRAPPPASCWFIRRPALVPKYEGPIRRTREGGSEWEPIKIFLEGDRNSNKMNTASNTRLRLTTQVGQAHVATRVPLDLGTNTHILPTRERSEHQTSSPLTNTGQTDEHHRSDRSLLVKLGNFH
jgi:hypothetical protein